MADEIKEFEEVLDAELRLLKATPKGRKRRNASENVLTSASQSNVIGLALSGGGIRSATFNLGILQALASLKMLKKIHYLSTVSGGGYIGTWLTALIHRAPNFAVAARVLDSTQRKNPSVREPEEIRYLREYSNYLTPRKGLLGPDVWTVIVNYLRNLYLNLAILICTLIALLVIPLLFTESYFRISTLLTSEATIVFSILLFVVAGTEMVANLSSLTAVPDPTPGTLKYRSSRTVLVLVITPVFLGTFLLNHWLWYNQLVLSPSWFDWAWVTGLVYAGMWGVGSLLGKVFRFGMTRRKKETSHSHEAKETSGGWLRDRFQQTREGLTSAVQPKKRRSIVALLGSGFIAGCAGGVLLMIVTAWVGSFSNDEPRYVILGVPLITFVMTLVATLHIGLTGHGFSEETREWWSRLGAYVALVMLTMTAFFLLALYGIGFLDWLRDFGGDQLLSWVKGGILSGWLLTTIAGIVAGRSSKTGVPGSSSWSDLLGKAAPYVFIVGLVLILQQLTDIITKIEIDGGPIADSPLMMVGTVVVFLGAAFLLSYQIGVNDFSMHAMYRNRLMRCYLGASNKHRNAQPFTDFDPADDDIPLHALAAEIESGRYKGPYPIVNTALNLVKGRKLAWQQRKAGSFAFTPLYSGYEHMVEKKEEVHPRKNIESKGYRNTGWYGDELTLGNVMAISGAAASPNMGYHSSPPLAFLMTIFNVRLGWWLGNPRYNQRKPRWRHGPPFGLFYLIFELFGMTDDESRYVYLSDGGHFENLGIYELVRRRCRLIIASDAGEDRTMAFGDLGNAIEKCRVDFGIDIEIDVEPIKPDENTGMSSRRFAVGKIRYDKIDPEAPVGTLLYLKASLTGSEPTDVLRYKAQKNEFPHQPTSDQWFAESQFESYRMLGYDILWSVFRPKDRSFSGTSVKELRSLIEASSRGK